MRLFVRNNVLELLSTLYDGFRYIQRVEPKKANAVLNDCYAGIDAIANIMESSLSEIGYAGYKSILVDIIKTLNLMATSDSEKEKEKLASELERLMDTVSDNLFHEKEVKVEILFLPYKYSMFDSMESVWLAASKDSECECYVMPIPYYNKDSQGKLTELNYEGDYFPKSIPIVNYKDYSISERNPDVIYIHNPYDNINRVTSVAPEYYSRELKKYSKILVYIPYYISTGVLKDMLTYAPGMLHADKIIVQSEEIRGEFLKVHPENKILSLGSPKIDKVINTKREDLTVPEEWSNIIHNRRVVLYGVHLHNIINHTENAIKKIRLVLHSFSKQEGMVLLWRPHPLTIPTLESMRPELLPQYLEIIKEFCDKQMGIYDDSTDFNRAIALSDAYFGDASSSLVSIYGITGKPVMFQDINVLNANPVENKTALMLRACTTIKDQLWFSSCYSNGLYRADIKTGEVEYICPFQMNHEQTDFFNSLHWNVQQYDNKLIFSPSQVEGIDVYDLDENRLVRYPLKNLPLLQNIHNRFRNSVLYKNFVFFIPRTYPAIVRFDVLTGGISYITDWLDDMELTNKQEGIPAYFHIEFYAEDHLLYLLPSRKYGVYKFDMETCRGHYIPFGNESRVCNGICFDGSDFWLSTLHRKYEEDGPWFNTSTTGPILKWDGITEVVEGYPIDIGNCVASSLFYEGGRFWLNVQGKRGLLSFKREAKELELVEITNGRAYEPDDPPVTMIELMCKVRHEDCYLLMFRKDPTVYKFKDGKAEAMFALYAGERSVAKQLCSDFIRRLERENITPYDFVLYETPGISTPLILSEICTAWNKSQEEAKAFSGLFNNPDGSCGTRIHEYIKQTVKECLKKA